MKLRFLLELSITKHNEILKSKSLTSFKKGIAFEFEEIFSV